MKFTTVFAVLATLATAVSATFLEAPVLDTNAKRFASGLLSPLPPARRGHKGKGSPTYGAPKGSPSGITNSCNSGPVQCCNSVTTANSDMRDRIEGLFGVIVGPDVAVGLTCSPLTVLGLSSGSCTAQTVCCENNKFDGVVAIGCSPINVNLI